MPVSKSLHIERNWKFKEDTGIDVKTKENVIDFLAGVYDEAAMLSHEDYKDYVGNEKDESAFKCDQVHFESDSEDGKKAGEGKASQKAMSEMAPNLNSVVTDNEEVANKILHNSIGPNSSDSRQTVINSMHVKQQS